MKRAFLLLLALWVIPLSSCSAGLDSLTETKEATRGDKAEQTEEKKRRRKKMRASSPTPRLKMVL